MLENGLVFGIAQWERIGRSVENTDTSYVFLGLRNQELAISSRDFPLVSGTIL